MKNLENLCFVLFKVPLRIDLLLQFENRGERPPSTHACVDGSDGGLLSCFGQVVDRSLHVFSVHYLFHIIVFVVVFGG